MDKSEKYIKMCEAAQEIQTKYFEGYDNGDYIHYPSTGKTEINVCEENCKSRITIIYNIWLPCQDQLQEMLDGGFDEKLLKFNKFVYPPILIIKPQTDDLSLEEIKKEWARVSRDMNLPIIESEAKIEFVKCDNKFQSFEQLWLAFIMKEKFNKIWNEEKQEWSTKN